eukprot:5055974-Pleurochrysis_carterae.AAC.2
MGVCVFDERRYLCMTPSLAHDSVEACDDVSNSGAFAFTVCMPTFHLSPGTSLVMRARPTSPLNRTQLFFVLSCI